VAKEVYPSTKEDKELEQEIITEIKKVENLQTKVRLFALNEGVLQHK